MNKTHDIGLDVHKETAAIAHAQEGSRGEPVYHGKCAASVQNVNRYLRFKARGKHENKVKVAVARELCAFVWELHRLLRDQLPASAQDQSAS